MAWTDPSPAGALDLATGDTPAATWFDAIIADLLVLGGTDGNQKTGLLNLLAGQLQFPAAQNASANVNTLDDYEEGAEGAWTPTLGGTATYTSNGGSYVKIGELVIVWGTIIVNSIGTGSTYVISGLPFTVGTYTSHEPGGGVSYFSGAAQNVVSIWTALQSGAATMSLYCLTAAAAAADINGPIFGNGTRVDFWGVYRV